MRSSFVTRHSSLFALLLILAARTAVADRDTGELLDWARPKVVLVYVQPGGAPRWGTGFLAERDRVITNEHVVNGARSVTVWANGAPYSAHVAATDATHDLAVLTLPGASLALKPLALAPHSRGQAGDRVMILASRAQFSRGIGRMRVWPVDGSVWGYSYLRWPNGLADYDLRLSAAAIPGDSGSPVLRLRDGAVVGIVRGRTNPDSAGRSDTAWAVPIEAAHALLARTHEPLAVTPMPDHYYLEPLAGR
jgi:S1-C subfamily serine protease